MHYMRWSKEHRACRLELTASGVPPLPCGLLRHSAASLNLEVRGTYGDPELIDAIAEHYHVPSDRILPVPGTSTANFIAMACAAPRGVCVALEQPVYDPLWHTAEFLGLRIVELPRRIDHEFEIPLVHVHRALRSGARAVIISNLHNPSGHMLDQDQVARIAAACDEHDAVLIVDEVYLDGASIVAGVQPWTAAGLGDNVIATCSLTKIYGLGSLRAGWMIASPATVHRAQTIMDMLSVNNAAASTALAIEAFRQIGSLQEYAREHLLAGQGVFGEWTQALNMVRTYPNYGAHFECVGLPTGIRADRFCDKLAREYDTQVVPGTFFGLPNHIRIGTAVGEPTLREGLRRIGDCLRQFGSESA